MILISFKFFKDWKSTILKNQKVIELNLIKIKKNSKLHIHLKNIQEIKTFKFALVFNLIKSIVPDSEQFVLNLTV